MSSPKSNIFWLSISRAGGLLLLFFAYTQLFAYLGPFQTGQFQFVLSLVAIFGVLIDLGVSQYITKKVAEDLTQARRYFHNFLSAEIILALLTYAAMVGFVALRGYEPVILKATLIAGFGVFMYGLTVPYLAIISAFQDLKKVAVVNFIGPLTNAGIILAAIYFKQGIPFLATQQVVFGLTALVIYLIYIRKYIPKARFFSVFVEADWRLIKKILVAALPFALLVSFSTIYNRIDVLLISTILGYAQTGLYTAAYKIVDLTNFFPAVVSHSLYPLLAGLMARQALTEVRSTLEKYIRFMVAIALPLAVGGSLLARQVMLVLTSGDSRFLPSAEPLSILVWAIAILFIYVTANSLVISQLTRYAVLITAINVVVNITGNVLLLPVLGIKAAAIMTVVSEGLQAVVYFYLVSKYITPLALKDKFIKPILAAGAMGLVIWPIRNFALLDVSSSGAKVLPHLLINLGLLAGIGFLVYVFSLYTFRFFTEEDKTALSKLLKKLHLSS
jgi:O-antigen/teichoic acid export membrane protein